MTHERTFTKYGQHPLAVDIHTHLGTFPKGMLVEVEDYWDRVSGQSWMTSVTNFATMHYAVRVTNYNLPWDDDAVYVKINGLGHIVHVTELA